MKLKRMTGEEFLRKIIQGERNFREIVIVKEHSLKDLGIPSSEVNDFKRGMIGGLTVSQIPLEGGVVDLEAQTYPDCDEALGKIDKMFNDLKRGENVAIDLHLLPSFKRAMEVVQEAFEALRKQDSHPYQYPFIDISYSDFSGICANRLLLPYAKAERTRFDYARLLNSNLYRGWLHSASFCGADLSGSCLERAVLYRSAFVDSNLRGVNLNRTNLQLAELSGITIDEKTTYGGSNIQMATIKKPKGPPTVITRLALVKIKEDFGITETELLKERGYTIE